ncbi:hypothetical protein JCM10212_002977 [Sporobolomyces blumeae]
MQQVDAMSSLVEADGPVASTSKVKRNEDAADEDRKPLESELERPARSAADVNREAPPPPPRAASEPSSLPKADEEPQESAGIAKREEKVEESKGDSEEEILFSVVPKANINGLKYSGGIRTLKEGMPLEIRRDKYNAHDRNAIEVRHERGLRIGYIAKTLAARLAPLMGERKIRLEGTAGPVPKNVTGIPSVPMQLSIYGRRKYMSDPRLDWAFPERQKKISEEAAKKRAAVEAKEKMEEEEAERAAAAKGKGKDTDSSNGGNGSNDLAMVQSLLLERKTRPQFDVLSNMFSEGSMDPARLPIHPCPPGKKDGSMRTNLMDFQKQGLAWMIKMEHPTLPKTIEDPPVQLWAKKEDADGHPFWHNVGTGTNQRERPILKRGGILADEMGLGKTMQTIALICTDDTGEGVLEEPEEPDERFDDMTLIVCPLSVASNWTDQFAQHVGKKRLKWHLYHGEGRELTKKQLRRYDVVITTYQTLVGGIEEVTPKQKTPVASGFSDDPIDANEADVVPSVPGDGPPPSKKQKRSVKDGTLHSIKWRRVVLDEGHLIKNPKAKMSRAAAELKAERRWVLTGTPIVNAAADLGAMIQFLRICRPLDDPEVWKRYVPAKASTSGKATPDPDVSKLLRAVVLSSTLRRTKNMVDANGQPLVKLPELKSYQISVKLPPPTRELYDAVFAQLGTFVKGIVDSGQAQNRYTQVLCYLLRLRQIACDPSLCPPEFIEMLREEDQASHLQSEFQRISQTRENTPEQMPFLRRLLDQLEDEPCCFCQSLMVEPRITICQHVYCLACIEQVVETTGLCTFCAHHLTIKDVVGPERSVTPSSARGGSTSGATSRNASRNGSVGVGTGPNGQGVRKAERTAKTDELVRLLKGTPKGVKSLVFSQWTSHLDRIEATLAQEGIATCRYASLIAVVAFCGCR